MAYATFTATVEMKVSLNIDGISPASWEEIQNCVFNVVEKENLLKREAYKGEIVLPPMDLDKIRREIGKAPEVSAVPEKPEDKYAKVQRYENSLDVIRIFKDAEAHPSDYAWEWRTAKVWMQEIPTLKNASLHGVAHTLGSMYKNGLTNRNCRYNDEIKQNEIRFSVPVPVEELAEAVVTDGEPAVISEENLKRGQKLRNAMKEHDVTVKELAELIGYNEDLINKWCWGLYTMSSAAREKLEEYFGKDLFSEGE